MKKLFVMMCLALATTGVFAEKGDVWLGVNACYNLDSSFKNFGVGAKAQWEFIDKFRLEPSFNYFLEANGFKRMEGNLNLHYLFNLGKKDFNIYPLAGFSFKNNKYDYKEDWERGIDPNLGGGIEVPLASWVKLSGECKWYYLNDYPAVLVGLSFGL